MKYLKHFGRYFIMLRLVFKNPVKWSMMRNLILRDIDDLVFGALGIVCFVSIFIGAVAAIQTALNLFNPLIPKYTVGFATRQSVVLEFSPTFVSVIMAGKIGSYITSSIGSMKVTEQIDALEVMGINSINYLIFPKIIAMMLYPFVIITSMFLGIVGGWGACIYGGYASVDDFNVGLLLDFKMFHLVYAFIKAFVFSFILATVPSYHGYYMQGGALEVGKSATTSFVWTTVTIIIFNYIITQFLLG